MYGQVPWSGVITNYSTSPFAEEAFDKLVTMLHEYAVVVNRWPQYTLVLENVSSSGGPNSKFKMNMSITTFSFFISNLTTIL